MEQDRPALYELDPLLAAFGNFQLNLSNSTQLNQFATSVPADLLNQYKNEIVVAEIAVLSLVLIIFALILYFVLYFVSLMASLLVEVPALVDAALWESLHLTPGQSFVVNDSDSTFSKQAVGVHCIAIAEVQHIPTLSTTGALLVDVRSYFRQLTQEALAKNEDSSSSLNYVWLHSNGATATLQVIRHELQDGFRPVETLNDRRALLESMQRKPLYLNLLGVLALGPITVLLLALLGNLIASWLAAQNRLSNFALLRAMGATPSNIAKTLSWEQAIIYTTSMVLGVLFGAFLSAMVVPALLFTSVTSSDASSQDFYLSQNIPPIQIIIPTLVGIVLALLVGLCVIVLGMMVRAVSRPAIAQTLRLNED